MTFLRSKQREDIRDKLRQAGAFGFAHIDRKTPEGQRAEKVHLILAGWE